MNISYYADINAAYIKLNKKRIVKTKKIADEVFIDLDSRNKVVGIEIIGE